MRVRAAGWSHGEPLSQAKEDTTHNFLSAPPPPSSSLAPPWVLVLARRYRWVPLKTLDLIDSVPPSAAPVVVGEGGNEGNTTMTGTSGGETSGGVGSSGSLESEVKFTHLMSPPQFLSFFRFCFSSVPRVC